MKLDLELVKKLGYRVYEADLDQINYEFLRNFIRENFLSVYMLAHLFGVKDTTIYSWEKREIPLCYKIIIYLLNKHPELINDLVWVERGKGNE